MVNFRWWMIIVSCLPLHVKTDASLPLPLLHQSLGELRSLTRQPHCQSQLLSLLKRDLSQQQEEQQQHEYEQQGNTPSTQQDQLNTNSSGSMNSRQRSNDSRMSRNWRDDGCDLNNSGFSNTGGCTCSFAFIRSWCVSGLSLSRLEPYNSTNELPCFRLWCETICLWHSHSVCLSSCMSLSFYAAP